MATLNFYSVGPHGQGWIISYDDSTVLTLPTKEGALAMARKLASEGAPSRLIIADRDGSTTVEDFLIPQPDPSA